MTDIDARPRIVQRAVALTSLSTRSTGDGLSFEGYAAVFNAPTMIDSWEGRFREQIRRGAFAKTLLQNTPKLQFDHGRHPFIGSIPIGVVTKAAEDERGVHVQASLHAGEFFAPVREAIRSGSVDGMSFTFEVVRDEIDHDTPDDIPMRTLVEIRVPELGPVVWPAYGETTASVRDRGAESVRSVLLIPRLRSIILDDPQVRAALRADLATTIDVPTAPATGHPVEHDSAPATGHPEVTIDAPVAGHPSTAHERRARDLAWLAKAIRKGATKCQ